jgi:hypothetical protein
VASAEQTAIGRRQPTVHVDHVFVEVPVGLGRRPERIGLVLRVDDAAVGNEPALRHLDAHHDRADPHEAPAMHHRVVHHRLEPDERLVAHVAGPVHQRVVGH